MQKGETNLIPRPQQNSLIGNFLLFSTLVLVVLFAQLSTTPFSKTIEYSGTLDYSKSTSNGTLSITKDVIPNTYLFYSLSVFLTSTEKRNSSFGILAVLHEIYGTRKKIRKIPESSLSFEQGSQVSCLLFEKNYVRSMGPEQVSIVVYGIPVDMRGYFVQIKGISFSRFASIIANMFSAIFVNIIFGVKLILQYKFGQSHSTDSIIIALYLSSIIFIIPSFLFQNIYVYYIFNILSSVFPGMFVISSFKVLEKAAPLVPLPMFIKEWTKFVLGGLISLAWLLTQIFEVNGIYIFIYVLIYLCYCYFIIAVYRGMQCQQRRIDESSAIWLRFVFYFTSAILIGRLIIPKLTFDTELPYILRTLSDWTIVGTIALALSYFMDDATTAYMNDDTAPGMIGDSGALLAGGSESLREDLRKDPVAKRRSLVDNLFNDAFDDDDSDIKLTIKKSKKKAATAASNIFSSFQ